jgi:hypothetical protein
MVKEFGAMMQELHVRASAKTLVREHGIGAWEAARRRTEELAEQGDWKAVGLWRRIGGAIRSIEQRTATH